MQSFFPRKKIAAIGNRLTYFSSLYLKVGKENVITFILLWSKHWTFSIWIYLDACHLINCQKLSPFKNHILCTSQLHVVCYLWIHWWFHELFMNYSSTTIFDLNIHVDSSSFIIFLVKKIMIMIEIFTAISYIFVDRYYHGCISLIHSHQF